VAGNARETDMTWLAWMLAALTLDLALGWALLTWRPYWRWTAEDLAHHPWSRSGRWELRVRAGWWVQPVLRPRWWWDVLRKRIQPYYEPDPARHWFTIALPGIWPHLCDGKR
jgi:hypothetical protein